MLDGTLESCWDSADSAFGFTQFVPDNGRPATDQTTAYLLYDRECLYVAWQCEVADAASVVDRLSGEGDGVRLLLDTFDDNTACYILAVSFSGEETGARMTDNGRYSERWDGVWFSRVGRHEWGFAVELALPFKSLRFRAAAGPQDWGIDFARYRTANRERAFWSVQPLTGFQVDAMGTLAGIEPGRQGLHVEFYPVALARAGLDELPGRWAPAAGLDACWLPTPTGNLQLTALPDFAEIEADPFQVNLSRFELMLEERRPFFVEASENFGTGYQPIRLFYSRRVGRPLPDGSAVPILAGIKYTDRSGRDKVGAFSCLTAEQSWTDAWGRAGTEPAALFTVASFRRQVLGNSEVGLLCAGKTGPAVLNHGVCVDGILRRGEFTAKLFGAGSQRDTMLGIAAAGNFAYRSGRFEVYTDVEHVGPDFDMNGVGFTTWRGQSVNFRGGPAWYAAGPFRYAGVSAYLNASREWDYPAGLPAAGAGFSSYFDFRNLMGLAVWGGWSRSFYCDTAGVYRVAGSPDGGLSFSTSSAAPLRLGLWAHWANALYNYRRSVLAPSLQGGLDLSAELGDRLSLELDNGVVAEFRPGYGLDLERDVTITCEPHIGFDFTPKMDIGLGGEVVRSFDPDAGRPDNSVYGLLLYRWTVRPRSTLHVALSQRLDNAGGKLALVDRVAVVKLRYLFVF
ncbi:carbohydrate binding family 9 domain-containing protein [candidate division WOR-3 bacterium]|nr:carbohydrate binding family 9 domain-containing protein [candidate division WOR-3 bacterium]